MKPSLIINDIDDGNDEDDDAYHCDDTVDACSSKESTNLLEKTAKQFVQAFKDAADKGNDECNDSNDDKQKDKEVLHNI